MSRIGNKVINLQEGVTVNVDQNNHVVVKGPKGELSYTFRPEMKIEVKDSTVSVSRPNDSNGLTALHGTTRSILFNMVEGVVNGFSRGLTIEGVGYRAQLQGNTLVINAGYSHPVELEIPEGLEATLKSPTDILISGADKQLVGEFAAKVRAVRPPEPYKGKGIRYYNEVIIRKEGKKAT